MPCHPRGTMPAPAPFTADDPFVAESAAPPPLRVDRDKCIIYGVRLVGRKSKNGHVYPEAAQRAAVPLFNNAPILIGHHYDPATMMPVEPPVEKKFGRVVNPRYENDGIHGDVKYNPRLSFADPFTWACENDPGFYAFSQLARMHWKPARDADGNKVAEAWRAVSSVDIVYQGGATSTIFESYTREAAVADETDEPGIPDAADVAGMLETPGAMIDWVSAFVGALKGIDQATKDTIVQTVVTALTTAAPPPADAPVEDPAVAPAVESLRRFGKVGQWAAEWIDARRRREWAGKLVTAEGLAGHLATDLFVETVAESFGKPDRAKALISERKQFGGGPGPAGKGNPRTSPPGDGGGKSVKDLVGEMAIG